MERVEETSANRTAPGLIGGGSADQLIGGRNADTFIFEAPRNSGLRPAADRIVDFQSGIDTLDLTAIDAGARSPGNQAFDFIGAAAFSGVAGELRYANGVVSADRNGDRLADLEVVLVNRATLSDGDLLL